MLDKSLAPLRSGNSGAGGRLSVLILTSEEGRGCQCELCSLLLPYFRTAVAVSHVWYSLAEVAKERQVASCGSFEQYPVARLSANSSDGAVLEVLKAAVEALHLKDIDIILDDMIYSSQTQAELFEILFLGKLRPRGVYLAAHIRNSFSVEERFGSSAGAQRKRLTMAEYIKDLMLTQSLNYWMVPRRPDLYQVHVNYTLHEEVLLWTRTVDCGRMLCSFRKRAAKFVPVVHPGY